MRYLVPTGGTRRLVAVLVVLGLFSSACSSGTGSKNIEIGLKRVALDLSFEAEDGEGTEAEAPADVLVAVEPQAVAEFAVTVNQDYVERGSIERTFADPVDDPCPKAGPGASPDEPASVSIRKPPAAGNYRIRRNGMFDLQSATFSLKAPMPPVGVKTYSDVRVIDPEVPEIYYQVREDVGDSYFIKEFRVTDDWLELVRMVIKIGEEERLFEPTPAVRYMNMGTGATDPFTHAGVDPATGTALVVEAQIEGTENVDVCGTLIDAYRVRVSERMTNAGVGGTPYTYETTDMLDAENGKPNKFWVATQKGGLFVKEEFHTLYRSGATSLQLDYTNTFSTLTPRVVQE